MPKKLSLSKTQVWRTQPIVCPKVGNTSLWKHELWMNWNLCINTNVYIFLFYIYTSYIWWALDEEAILFIFFVPILLNKHKQWVKLEDNTVNEPAPSAPPGPVPGKLLLISLSTLTIFFTIIIVSDFQRIVQFNMKGEIYCERKSGLTVQYCI